VIFTSIEPEQISPEVTALGVRHLAELLRFTRDGGQPAAERAARPPATELTAAIAAALTAKGWTVHHQVGCAAYRIDLAVVDPDDPGRYVLGVETDGPAYALAATARDRDRLRAQVLAGLGWRLHRIWSLDWFHAADKELARVHNAIINAIAAARAAKKGGATRSGPVAAPEATAPAAAPTPPGAGPTPPSAGSAPPSAGSAPTGRAAAVASPARAARPAPARPAVERTAIGRYAVASVPAGRRTVDDLYDVGRVDELGKVLDAVLAVEAPIHVGLLARRVAAYFGIGRMSPRVIERVRLIAATRAQVGSPSEPDVVWRRDQDPAALPSVRVPDDGHPDSKRDWDELPVVEIAAAARVVLERNLGLPRTELVRETGKLLGFGRQGDKVLARLAEGVEVLIARGLARVDGERISVP
jgi:very-short-patch-repair endonuclease